jgi:hypothetical protein
VNTEPELTSTLANYATKPSLEHDETAQVFFDCLRGHDLPARLVEENSEAAAVEWENTVEVHMQLEDGSSFNYYPLRRSDQTFDQEDFWRTSQGKNTLLVDRVDCSKQLNECLDASGYSPPPARSSEDRNRAALLNRQAIDSTNDWVRCAREEGWPDFGDATKTEDLAVVVPLAMSSHQLSVLLATCPALDEELVQAAKDGIDSSGGDVVLGPSLAIEYPDESVARSLYAPGVTLLDHYNELDQILVYARSIHVD